jgi:hypothetical protein
MVYDVCVAAIWSLLYCHVIWGSCCMHVLLQLLCTATCHISVISVATGLAKCHLC